MRPAIRTLYSVDTNANTIRGSRQLTLSLKACQVLSDSKPCCATCEGVDLPTSVSFAKFECPLVFANYIPAEYLHNQTKLVFHHDLEHRLLS